MLITINTTAGYAPTMTHYIRELWLATSRTFALETANKIHECFTLLKM